MKRFWLWAIGSFVLKVGLFSWLCDAWLWNVSSPFPQTIIPIIVFTSLFIAGVDRIDPRRLA